MLNGKSVLPLAISEAKVERLYRIILLVLFIIGFVGAAASKGNSEAQITGSNTGVVSLINDVRMAQEVNALNTNSINSHDDGLAKVEMFLAQLAKQDFCLYF